MVPIVCPPPQQKGLQKIRCMIPKFGAADNEGCSFASIATAATPEDVQGVRLYSAEPITNKDDAAPESIRFSRWRGESAMQALSSRSSSSAPDVYRVKHLRL